MGELGNAAMSLWAAPAIKGIIVIALIWVLLLWHRRSDVPVDLTELVLDGGKLSSRKLFESGAFALTSIWFMGKVIAGNADVTDALGYAGLWVAARTAGQAVHARAEAVQKPAGDVNAGTA